MNARYLIVNADDFGMTGAGDAAIESLFAAERITSTTLLAPALRAGEARQTAREKGYPVGVHWTLHAEWAAERWLPSAGADRVPSLCEDGALIPNAARASKAARSADVQRELFAQAAFLPQGGVAPDHADSHGGTLYGVNGRLFFLNAFQACRKLNLSFRFPRRSDFLRRQFGHEPGGALKAAHGVLSRLAGVYGVPLIDDFITNPYPAAKIDGYAALKDFYEREIASAGPGVTEVFLHPSLPDETLLMRTPEWQKRVWEYEYLTSDAFDNLLRREGFHLTSWGNAPLHGKRKKGATNA